MQQCFKQEDLRYRDKKLGCNSGRKESLCCTLEGTSGSLQFTLLFKVVLTEKFESGKKAVVMGLQTAFPSLELIWKMV